MGVSVSLTSKLPRKGLIGSAHPADFFCGRTLVSPSLNSCIQEKAESSVLNRTAEAVGRGLLSLTINSPGSNE